MRARATVRTREQLEALLIDERTRLRDVATVSLTADTDSSALRANGKTGVGLGLIAQTGSSTLDVSAAVHAVVEQIRPGLPDGVDLQVTSDDAVFISGSIREVLRSLALAISIVIGIIFLFLLDWRATLIPAVTLPVALVGTVAGIWVAGFSINILTLLALVLATGLVVDDAIVVLENIVNRRRAGLGAMAAAVIGTRQVFFAVITTTAVLAAVFIPLSFLPGQAGGLFREFGFVLAIAVVISSLVALSLCPMMASRLLRDAGETRSDGPQANLRQSGDGLSSVMRRVGGRMSRWYAAALRAALAAPLLVVALAGLFALLAWITLADIRQELLPAEDRSVVLLRVSAPQGVSLDFTLTQLRRVEDGLQPLVESGEVRNVFSIAGRGGANSGFMVATLVPWEQRERDQQAIVDDISGVLQGIPGISAFPIQPNSLGIRGAGSGLSVALAGSSYEKLAAAGDELVAQLEADPRFGRVELDYETSQPQLSITIDRERASDLGIPVDRLADALQVMLDGRQVAEVFIDDRAVPVKLMSTTQPVNDPVDLANLFLRAGDGRSVPMSSIATLEETAIAPELTRDQRSRAVRLSAGLTPEFTLGDALQEMTRLADPVLPEGSQLIPLAEAAALNETSSGLLLTFGFAVVVVFLVLAAQFESFLSAVIIMVTVPLGLASAVFALSLSGTSLNIYSQIGLVLLVGIMAKNGILIVEFANQLRDEGLGVGEAAFEAATRRLRPVTMTLFSTVLGGLPLVLASGAGAEARIALGWVIVGGLGIAALFTLFVTPVAYRLLAGWSAPKSTQTRRLDAELAAVARSD